MEHKKGKKGLIVWVSVGAFLLALIIVGNILFSGMLHAFMNSVFGGERRVGGSDATYYSADYDTKEAALQHANDVNLQICEEGFVLLKNENGALPLATSAADRKKVSVFGKNSAALVYGGSGSGGASNGGTEDIYSSLEAAGYEVNPSLKSFYESASSGSGRPSNPPIENAGLAGLTTGETPVSSYGSVRDSFSQYSDLALVVFSRIGGEGFDLPTTMQKSFFDKAAVDGAYSAEDHYLELDRNEQEMLQMVCESFDRVVVLVNSSEPMELGFLDSADDRDKTAVDYDFASKIDAALWIGSPGDVGILALGEILSGAVNPSGRTVDTYARDFSEDPTFVNFGTNGVEGSDAYTLNGKSTNYYFIDYEEGIYVGYRYYETRGFTDGEDWYKDHVVYPFGYGLSYTDFEWTVKSAAPAADSVLRADDKISVTVEVKNTGSVAGKDVVELYLTAPYTKGGIEKAHKTLVGYEKTPLIGPGETKSVTIELLARDLASYDYSDANKNGFKGYELEAGEYLLSVSRNAHEAVASVGYRVEEGARYETDAVTGNAVENRYDDADDQLATLLSRSDWNGTWPARRTADERVVTQAFLDAFSVYDSGSPLTADSPEVKNADLTYATKKLKSEVQLFELIGAKYDDERWEKLLSDLTISSMALLCDTAAFNTAAIDYIGKPVTTDADGPAGFTIFMGSTVVYDTCVYASECVIGATWNRELAEEMGKAVGNEGIVGNLQGDGAPYSGWYAPAVNIHRSPFSGRNFEYYSEDGLLNGKMAAAVIRGAASKGVYTMLKHFVANDQETHRSVTGLCTWMTEQSLREIYMRPFEIAVKEGGTHGVMSSFNRVGTKWTGGDYRLLTEVLRGEWGFRGSVICDFATGSYMDKEQMAYAGGDLLLSSVATKTWVDKNNPVDLYVIKRNVKNILYTVANSNAMNGVGEGIAVKTAMPYWQIWTIVISCVIAAGVAIWGCFAVMGYYKGRKQLSSVGEQEETK